MVETLSEDWDETPEVTGVIVTGERMGVTARLRRAGSAGDQMAETVIDPLITAPEPARSRGLSVLAASGRLCSVQITMPVFPEVGLALPGDLVSVTGSDAFRALVRGVRLSAELRDALVVRQTLDLERR